MLLLSCSKSTYPKVSETEVDVTGFIMAAVSDFSKRNFRRTRDRTYSVTTKVVNDQLLVVSFYGSTGKMIVTPERGYEEIWATNCMEKDGRLFYWREEDKSPVGIISKLKAFDLIDSVNSLAEVELVTDHRKKSIDYYFCKDNTKSFKVVASRSLVGNYRPPSLNCK